MGCNGSGHIVGFVTSHLNMRNQNKNQTMDNLHPSLITHFPCVQSCISFEFEVIFDIKKLKLSSCKNSENIKKKNVGHMEFFKRTQIPYFSTDFDEIGFKILGL